MDYGYYTGKDTILRYPRFLLKDVKYKKRPIFLPVQWIFWLPYFSLSPWVPRSQI